MLKKFWDKKNLFILTVSSAALFGYVVLRFVLHRPETVYHDPLIYALIFCGLPLTAEILIKVFHGEFGADVLAVISIITTIFLHEYLAGIIVVSMLSGGALLEAYAVRSASSVLEALSRRMPSIAHRKKDGVTRDIDIKDIQIGDVLVVFPHEIAPVDGVVVEGHGTMDESYLTGEPFKMSKTPGATVFSGAINGEAALSIQATKLAVDSRYVKITEVLKSAEEKKPQLRRMGDQLGAVYTPLALIISVAAWLISGESVRFLAVLVVATPCPLIIGIPVVIIASISLCARRGIIVKNPLALEQIKNCRTAIFDKTGTLTYGEPALVEQLVQAPFDASDVLLSAASLERYSKHPLAVAILNQAEKEKLPLLDADQISETPGQGLKGLIKGEEVQVVGRKYALAQKIGGGNALPPAAGGMECLVLKGGKVAALYRFRDTPRKEGATFINHLGPKHQFGKIMIVSGDRESEVRYLAEEVGLTEIYAGQTPENKLSIVREESKKEKTLFIGDGINDAPALMAATVGMAIGQNSDITSEAASVVILDSSLTKVDEFFHISERMRAIALQSAIGGMLLSVVGMGLAASGKLPPVAGALMQEIIDVIAILNALRAAWAPAILHDFEKS